MAPSGLLTPSRMDHGASQLSSRQRSPLAANDPRKLLARLWGNHSSSLVSVPKAKPWTCLWAADNIRSTVHNYLPCSVTEGFSDPLCTSDRGSDARQFVHLGPLLHNKADPGYARLGLHWPIHISRQERGCVSKQFYR
jgi:hypothetical protein